MANFYDQPAQAQFINTYVPIPFEEIAQAATTRYQRHQQGLAGLESMLSEIENITPYSDPDKEKVKNYRASLQEIVDKYGSGQYDLGSSQVIRDISKDVKKNIDRKVLTDINKNYELATRYNELALQNQTPREFLYDWKSHDTSTSGLYTGLPERGLDTETAIAKFFNEVGTDYLYEKDLGGGRRGSMVGVSENKLAKHVIENAERLMSDPAINQYMRRKGLNPNDVEALTNMLLSEAPKYTKSNIVSVYNAGEGEKESPYSMGNTGNTPRNINPYINPDNPLKGSQLELSLEERINKGLVKHPGAAIFVESIMDDFGPNRINKRGNQKPKKSEDTINKERSKVIDLIKKTTVDPKTGATPLVNASEEEVINIYSQARQSISTFDNKKIVINDIDYQKDISPLLIRDMGTRGLTTANSNKKMTSTTVGELYDELGIKPQEGDAIYATGIVPARSSFEMVIVDKNGYPRDKGVFQETMLEEERMLFDPLSKAQDINLRGEVGFKTFNSNGKDYLVKTGIIPVSNENGYTYTFGSALYQLNNPKPNSKGEYDIVDKPDWYDYNQSYSIPLDEYEYLVKNVFLVNANK